jgi:hypothetical protein
MVTIVTSDISKRGKAKVEFKGLWGSECIDPGFVDLGTSWR